MLVSEVQYNEYITLLQSLNSFSNIEELISTIRKVRNISVGCEKLRLACLEIGLVDKFVDMLEDFKENTELVTLLFHTLSDFANSTLYFTSDRCVKSLKTVIQLFEMTDNLSLIEACARYCYSITKFAMDDTVLNAKQILLKIVDYSDRIFEHVSLVIGYIVCCDSSNAQTLVDLGIIAKTKPFLIHERYFIKLLALNLLRLISSTNSKAMIACMSEKLDGGTVQDLLLNYIRRTKMPLIRLLASQILCNAIIIGVGLPQNVIEVKLLPALVNLSCCNEASYVTPHALMVLTQILTVCPKLQTIAMYCEEFPKFLLSYLKLEVVPFYRLLPTEVNSVDFFFPFCTKFSIEGFHSIVLQCVASLICVEEQNRRIFSKNRDFMTLLPKFLSSDFRPLVSAALLVNQMLSRSVHVLRSTFDDNEISTKVLDMLMETCDVNAVRILSALIANLMLILVPKQKILVNKITIPKLFELTSHFDQVIVSNCLWALINASFRCDSAVQDAILKSFNQARFVQLTLNSGAAVRAKVFVLLLNLSRYPTFEQFIKDNEEDFLKVHAYETSAEMIRHLCDQKKNRQAVKATFHDDDDSEECKRCLLNLFTKLAANESHLNMFTDEVIQSIFAQLEQQSDIGILQLALETISNLFHLEDDDASNAVRTQFIDLGIAKVLTSLSKHCNTLIRSFSEQILDSFEKEN